MGIKRPAISHYRRFSPGESVYNWTKDVIVCTNGKEILSTDQKNVLESKGIKTYEQEITSLVGENGRLEEIKFHDGTFIARDGGFIAPEWEQASTFAQTLGCALNGQGGVKTDVMGRTNVEGVYASGDTTIDEPSQLVIAAAAGNKAAMGVNADLIEENFS